MKPNFQLARHSTYCLFISYDEIAILVHSRLGKPSRTSVARPSCRRLDRLLQPCFDMRVAAAAAGNEFLATKKWGNRVSKSTPIQDKPVMLQTK